MLAGASLGISTESVACSGATVANFSTAQSLSPNGTSAPQLDAVDASNRLVSVTIGGNDADFSGLFAKCLSSVQASDHPCADTYTTGSLDVTAASFGGALGGALDQIRARAPQAKVFVVGYLGISPASGECFASGRLKMTAGDAPLVRYWQQRLRDTQHAAAVGHGANFVDAFALSSGHDACAADGQRWVYADGEGSAPLHPNEAGQQALASMLVTAARDVGPYLEVPPARPPHSPAPAILIKRKGSKLRPVKRSSKPFTRSKPRRGGLALRVTLLAPQRVTFRLQQPGRPVWRWKNYGPTMSFSLPAGTSTIWATGRQGRKKLKPGHYRVRAKIRDGAFWDTERFRVVR